MQFINRLADTVVRRIGWPRETLGRWLKAGGVIVLLYLALELLVAGFWIHRVPHYTSLMLVTVFGTALAMGLSCRGTPLPLGASGVRS